MSWLCCLPGFKTGCPTALAPSTRNARGHHLHPALYRTGARHGRGACLQAMQRNGSRRRATVAGAHGCRSMAFDSLKGVSLLPWAWNRTACACTGADWGSHKVTGGCSVGQLPTSYVNEFLYRREEPYSASATIGRTQYLLLTVHSTCPPAGIHQATRISPRLCPCSWVRCSICSRKKLASRGYSQVNQERQPVQSQLAQTVS